MVAGELCKNGGIALRDFVRVNGRSIEIDTSGHSGTSVVILPGMGCPMNDWTDIMETLSDRCRVLAFHRAGCGLSEVNPNGPSVLNTVHDLRDVLASLAIQGQVILVGHSYGGLCAQRFAREYPDKVRGMVLVDSSSTDMERLDFLTADSDAQWMQECSELASMTPDEIREQNSSLLTEHQSNFSSESVHRITEFYTSPTLYKTMLQEVEVWYQCAADTKNSGEFPEIPLIVIGRDPDLGLQQSITDGTDAKEAQLFETMWRELIEEQSKLSPKGKFVIASGATHCVYENRADVVLAAIDELLAL